MPVAALRVNEARRIMNKNGMTVVNRKISSIRPYAGNAKLHTEHQINQIVESIRNFGFNDPIGIDEDGMIIEGHGRWQAAKQLEMDTVPCIVLEGLTEEQKKAYILIHNKLTMNTGFDLDLLNSELEGIKDIDMGLFDFELPEIKTGKEITPDIDYAARTQQQVENILQLGYAQFSGVGKYDIPQIKPVYDVPEVKEWIGFNYILSDDDPSEKGVHFFIDDYQFERVWNNPDKYIDRLKQYKAVLSPDFSPYGDMPLICQMFNHYRKHWVAAYWQMHGINVIPTIRASTDPRSLVWFCDGEPKQSVVAFSTMWADIAGDETKAEFLAMRKQLKPTHILVYGKNQPYMEGCNISRIETFAEKRWGNGETKARRQEKS